VIEKDVLKELAVYNERSQLPSNSKRHTNLPKAKSV
jgi:hypothetical protein